MTSRQTKLFRAGLAGAFLLALAGCGEDGEEKAADSSAPADEVQIPNPASQNCAAMGGMHEAAESPLGTYGICVFEDNRQCEEWALLKGACPEGGVKITGYATDAARYCVITGGTYQAGSMAGEAETGTCTVPGGKTCKAEAYFSGTCRAE